MRGGKGSITATTVLIGVLVVLVAGMAVYIVSTRNSGNDAPEEERELRNYVVTEENADEVIQEITKPRSAGSYTAKMNSEWHFPDGKSPSTDAYVANSADNKWPVWFDVTLSSGESVYESPILPVDTYVQNFALDKELEAGTYSGTITYHLVDEDQNELSTLSIGVTIIVES